MRQKKVAILFCFLLGGGGGHKFYLGEYFLGLVYLIFCWTFIPALISIVDLVNLILISPEDFNSKYNEGKPAPGFDFFGEAQNDLASSVQTLEALARLHEKQIINADEFEKQKTKILKKIG